MSPPVTFWPGPRSVWLRWRGPRAALGGDARGGLVAATHPVVGPSDQPVAAGDDESRRGEGDLAELGVAAGVLAPQAADDVDGLLGVAANSRPA